MTLITDKKFNSLQYFTADNIHSPNVTAIFTTSGLNFGLVDEKDDEATASYKVITSSQGFSESSVLGLWQKHSDSITTVDEASAGALSAYSLTEQGDALVTDVKGVLLSVRVADCAPILFYDGKNKAVGAVHAGWRGAFAQIGPKTIRRMTECYGTNPADIKASIGSAIGICCYEVSFDFYENFKKEYGTGIDKFFIFAKGKKPHFNLNAMNESLLIDAGILANNIEVSEFCTMCNPDLLHSYRRDGDKSGRLAAFIGMK